MTSILWHGSEMIKLLINDFLSYSIDWKVSPTFVKNIPRKPDLE